MAMDTMLLLISLQCIDISISIAAFLFVILTEYTIYRSIHKKIKKYYFSVSAGVNKLFAILQTRRVIGIAIVSLWSY